MVYVWLITTACAIEAFVIVILKIDVTKNNKKINHLNRQLECRQCERDLWFNEAIYSAQQTARLQPWYDLLVKPYIDVARNWSA